MGKCKNGAFFQVIFKIDVELFYQSKRSIIFGSDFLQFGNSHFKMKRNLVQNIEIFFTGVNNVFTEHYKRFQ